MPVHPRVGGERPSVFKDVQPGDGSSPRGRGTLFAVRHDWPPKRFIPAWAGNAEWALSAPSAWSVHPRVGGERLQVGIFSMSEAGSSPRGRGTRRSGLSPCITDRFIPAWAGNARAGRRHKRFVSVHPRVGGERLRQLWQLNMWRGSSPRGRGTRFV